MTNITRMILPWPRWPKREQHNAGRFSKFIPSHNFFKKIYINKGKKKRNQKKRNQSKSQERDIESWKQSSGQTLTCSLKMAWNLPLSILEFVVFSQHFSPINNLLKQQLYRECYKQCYFMTTQLFYLPRIGCGEKKSIKKKKTHDQSIVKKITFYHPLCCQRNLLCILWNVSSIWYNNSYFVMLWETFWCTCPIRDCKFYPII